MNILIVEMVQLGLRHSAIAHSLGLSPPVLRQYFTRELTQTATQATLAALASLKGTTAALFHLKMRQPLPLKASSSKRDEYGSADSFDFTVYNNDGEPNYPY
jgi:hypothetical protein